MPEAQAKFFTLHGSGELAVDHQISRLDVIAVRGELLDGVAAMAQHAVVAIEVGDLALTRTGVAVALVVGDVAGGGAKRTGVDGFLPFGANHDRQGVFFIVDLQ